MTDRRCETCAHWARTADEVDAATGEFFFGEFGTCRRHPPAPTPAGPGEAPPPGRFPVTALYDWCGEWASSDPAAFDQAASAMARATLAGDLTAARALADRLGDLA